MRPGLPHPRAGGKNRPLPDLSESVELILGNDIYIAKEVLSPGFRNRLLRMAAFQNPEFYKAQAMRLSTYGTPRSLRAPRIIRTTLGYREDVSRT